MADRHDYVALEWVKGEIETTLNLARQALESYVEDAQDSTQLGFCFNYLHQVNGTLQMVEFYGAALLSEELEKLAQKLVDEEVEATEENLSILMQGILQLPNYLDKVKEYQQDLPIVILPIINEIRTACHEEMLSAGMLFQPDLSKTTREFPPIADAYKQAQFTGLVQKLRQMYQVALLGLLKNQDSQKNLAYIEKVMTHLNKHCANTPVSIYWNLAQALVIGLQDSTIELNASTKEILKFIDQSIKSVIDDASALGNYVAEDQIKNILFYIAQSNSQSPYISKIKSTYNLDEALPSIDGFTSQNAMAGPDKEAMHSVIVALTEETTKIKEQIEELTNQGATKDDIVATKDAIKPIGDTMAALGFTDLRKVLLEQFKVLESAEQNNQMLSENQLMEMAGALLFVESSMSGATSHNDGAPLSMLEGVSDAHNAVIREARNGLEQTKDAIVEYIGSQWNIEKLDDIPQTLKAISGGLRMIPLHKASNIIDACEQYFSKNLIEDKKVPQWDELDQLADSLMGIEYFLERMTQDGRGSNTSLLNTAQERIEALGIRVAASDEIEEPAQQIEEVSQVEESEIIEETQEDAPELITPVVSTQEVEEPVQTQSAADEDEDDLIDDEILEIFVEEAGEVLEAIHEYLPKYKADAQDKDSLTEFRRAFHTLKGSGRMVGANDIGELAWSIESMLNKHIEGLVDYSDALFEIVEDVTEYVPTLVQQFEKREQADLAKIEVLTNRANAIAAGEVFAETEAEEEIVEVAEQPSELELVDESSSDESPELELIDEVETLEPELEVPDLELVDHEVTDEVSSEDDSSTEMPTLEIVEDDSGIDFELEEIEETVEIDATTPDLELESNEDSIDIPELTLEDQEPETDSIDIPELTLEDQEPEADSIDIPELTLEDQEPETDSIDIPELTLEDQETEADSIDIPELTLEDQAPETDSIDIPELTLEDQEPETDSIDIPELTLEDQESEAESIDIPELTLEDQESEADSIDIPELTLEDQEAEADSIDIPELTLEDQEPETDSIDIPDLTLDDQVSDELLDIPDLTLDDQVSEDDSIEIPELTLEDEVELEVPVLVVESQDNDSIEIPELSIVEDDEVEPETLAVLEESQPEVEHQITDEMLGINDDQRNEKIQSEDPDFVEYEVDEGSLDSLFGGDFEEEEPETEEVAAQEESDDTIHEIFTEELESHLQTVKEFLQQGTQQELSEELQRALHTIKGAAHMAGVMQLAEAMSPVEKLVQTMYQLNVLSDAEINEVLRQSVERCEHAISNVSACLVADESSQGFADYVHDVMSRHLDAKAEPQEQTEENPLQTFLSATMDDIIDSEEMTDSWSSPAVEQDQIQQLHTSMLQLAENSQAAGQSVFEAVALKLVEFYQSVLDDSSKLNDQFVQLAKLSQDTLVNLMDRLAAAQTLEEQSQLTTQLSEFISTNAEEVESDDSISIDFSDEHNDTAGIDFTIGSDDSEPEAIEFSIESDPEPQEVEDQSIDTPSVHKKSFIVSADDDLVEIFIEEATELTENIRQLLMAWQENIDDLEAVENLQRDLHTIKGGARMAQISPLGDLAHEIEFLYEGLHDKRYDADPSIFGLLQRCQDEISDMVQDIEAQGQFEYDPTLIDQVKAYCENNKASTLATVSEELAIVDKPEIVEDVELAIVEESEEVNESGLIQGDDKFVIDSDQDLIEIFLEEAEEILESIQVQFETWKQDISNLEPVHILQRDLHTLKGGARMATISPIGDLGHELEFLYEGIVNNKYQADESLVELIENCHNSLSDMVHDIQSDMSCKNDRFLLECVQNYCAGNGFNLSDYNQANEPEDQDESLLSIFVGETQGLLGQLTQARLAWRYSPNDTEQSDIIKRVLHTIKGGAGLAEQNELSQDAVDSENFVIESDSAKKNDAFFDELDEKLGKLEADATKIINEFLNNDSGTTNSEEVGTQIDQWITGDATQTAEPLSLEESIQSDISEPTAESDKDENYDNVIEFDSSVLSDIKQAMQPKTAMDIADDAKRLAGEQEATDKKRRGQSQESVKVQANILDGLVNLAGETSISRARLEQEVADFNFTLSEMNSAIDRMNEQIRRLDNETQEQVAYRQEQAEEELEEFDPLEMDRYSSIQQLSRSIMESASDLGDLQDTLKERTRDTETILLQQSRINTELQEGLMQTRMVPFSGIAPRLRRIIRQTSSELKKKASLEFYNIEGEVDRTVLERMVAPLEHMLRNSIDHGIEMPKVREQAGKAKAGKIELSLTREGSYMVLTLRDDGAGINIERIREKAVEKGLMKEDANLTDQEILMFILDAGFSTADKVTQISGRGVGMDVVNSEVKQLGGVMSIDSNLGKGTLFTIRIPVTVSLSRALMVSIEDDIYALPLNSIEGIVRVSPAQMQQFYQPDAPKFRYAGQDYKVQYLGSLMDETLPAHIPSDVAAIPLILVHGVDSEHTLALHVDQLLGSREIVVKSMGPQFTSVTGLTGATILGDGSVVVILDLPSMIRSNLATESSITNTLQIGAPVREETEDRAKRVMVVDDSVTVRKVTSRLLERNGYEVILAKDGQDAVTQLQEVRPDIMLLDIEMPRMDGFEVATRVRHNPEISDLPIIMITSRTGEKHKERALSIGVNEYLGKPFQEGPLLEIIQEQLELAKA